MLSLAQATPRRRDRYAAIDQILELLVSTCDPSTPCLISHLLKDDFPPTLNKNKHTHTNIDLITPPTHIDSASSTSKQPLSSTILLIPHSPTTTITNLIVSKQPQAAHNILIKNCINLVKNLTDSAQTQCAAKHIANLIKHLENKEDSTKIIKKILIQPDVQFVIRDVHEIATYIKAGDPSLKWQESNYSNNDQSIRLFYRPEDDGTYSLKVAGIMNRPMPHILSMLSDPQLVKFWFPFTNTCQEIFHAERPKRLGTAINYMLQDMPFPLSQRDWLIQQCLDVDLENNCVHVSQRSLPEDITIPVNFSDEIKHSEEEIREHTKKLWTRLEEMHHEFIEKYCSFDHYDDDDQEMRQAINEIANMRSKVIRAQLFEVQSGAPRGKKKKSTNDGLVSGGSYQGGDVGLGTLGGLGMSVRQQGRVVRGAMFSCGASAVALDSERTFVEARLRTDIKFALPGWLMLKLTKIVGLDAFHAMEKLSDFDADWKYRILETTRANGFNKGVDELYDKACANPGYWDDEKIHHKLMSRAFIDPEIHLKGGQMLLDIATKYNLQFNTYQ